MAMTKQEVERRIQKIIDAIYNIQDRIKNGERVGILPGQGIVAQIDGQFNLKRTNTRFEIIGRNDGIKYPYCYTNVDQDYISIISSLIEKYLKLM